MAKRGRFIDTSSDPSNLLAIWNQLHALDDRLALAEGTVSDQADTITDLSDQLVVANQQIQQALVSSGKTTGTGTTGTGEPASGGSSGPPVPDHGDIVQAVLGSFAPPLSAADPNSRLFDFIREVVWQISLLGTDPPGMLVGLLHQDGGDGTYTCAGDTYATFRLCYDNGANIKVLTGNYTAQWTPEGPIPIADWRAPVDPSAPC